MKRGSKGTRRRLYRAEILEIYLLLYIFVKFQVFPPTSSQPRLYDLSSLPPPLSLSLPLISLSHYLRELRSSASSGPLHLCFVTSASSSYLSEKIFEDAYLTQASSNIAHCGTFIESVDSSGFSLKTYGKILLLMLPAN